VDQPSRCATGSVSTPSLSAARGDRGRVDQIRLPRLADCPPRCLGQPRRDPDHSVTAREKPALQPARHVPAVLERPHALGGELGHEPQRLKRAVVGCGDRQPPARPRWPHRARQACASACVSTPITIICPVPSLEIWPDGADLRRTHLSQGCSHARDSTDAVPRRALGAFEDEPSFLLGSVRFVDAPELGSLHMPRRRRIVRLAKQSCGRRGVG
jgi:hypothetical protein